MRSMRSSPISTWAEGGISTISPMATCTGAERAFPSNTADGDVRVAASSKASKDRMDMPHVVTMEQLVLHDSQCPVSGAGRRRLFDCADQLPALCDTTAEVFAQLGAFSRDAHEHEAQLPSGDHGRLIHLPEDELPRAQIEK